MEILLGYAVIGLACAAIIAAAALRKT